MFGMHRFSVPIILGIDPKLLFCLMNGTFDLILSLLQKAKSPAYLGAKALHFNRTTQSYIIDQSRIFQYAQRTHLLSKPLIGCLLALSVHRVGLQDGLTSDPPPAAYGSCWL